MKQIKTQATDLKISGIESKFYALKHGGIKNEIGDKDKSS